MRINISTRPPTTTSIYFQYIDQTYIFAPAPVTYDRGPSLQLPSIYPEREPWWLWFDGFIIHE